MRRYQAPPWAPPQGPSPSAPARHRWETVGVWGGRVCIGWFSAGLVLWALARFAWFGTSDAVPWWLYLWGGAGWGALLTAAVSWVIQRCQALPKA